jgi:hypothetical protein
MNATGTIESYTFDGGIKKVFGTTVLTPSNWYYVTAVAQNSGNMRVYLNGVEEGTPASINTLWTGGDRYYFGSNSADSMGFFGGIIDELRFSSSVRSSSWIQAEYKNGAGTFSTFQTEQSATSTQWNFYNNASVTSSTTISTVLLPSSDILGSYQEGNPTALNPFAVNAGQYIEYDWVIQGGDPTGTGGGGTSIYGPTFEDELNSNTESYKEGYKEGVLAMANRGPNTNGSQFFILTQDYPLDHNYTIFGKVTSGMDIVKQIKKGDKILGITVE